MRKLRKPWLQAYEEYVSQTESPLEYNTWCGISAIGSVMRRNTFISYGFYNIYANQYVVLVGPPAVGKGTAINPAVELVKKIDVVNYISDRITAEKFVECLTLGKDSQKIVNGQLVLSKDKSATIVSTELPIFLQASEWMLPLMCEMWEKNQFSYSTKTKSSYVAKDLCTGLIGACVPDFIRKLNRDATSAITGGFTSRCIFVYASERSKLVAWPPSQNGAFHKLEDDLAEDLKVISELTGEFSFTPEARKLWENQYGSMTTSMFESDVLTGFKGRMKSHIFKVAMALSVSEDDNLIINRNHLFNAINLVNKIRDKVDIVFRAIGESPLAHSQERVRLFIENKGMASRSEILKYNYSHVTDEQLDIILRILCQAGVIEERLEASGNGHKKIVYYDLLGMKTKIGKKP